MKRLFFFACVITLGLGLALGFHRNRQHNFPSVNSNVSRPTDGAFRDGLYLGRFAASHGAEFHIAVARWATTEDRASFTAGYQRGYNEFLRSRVTPREPPTHARVGFGARD